MIAAGDRKIVIRLAVDSDENTVLMEFFVLSHFSDRHPDTFGLIRDLDRIDFRFSIILKSLFTVPKFQGNKSSLSWETFVRNVHKMHKNYECRDSRWI